jgi:hypothetical protein
VGTLSDDLRTLSYEAALYFYPLVMMDVTRRQAINTPAAVRSSHANEYSVSKFGRTTARMSAGGNALMW